MIGIRSLIVGALLPALVPAAARPADRFDGMQAYVQAAMEHWEVPGLAIAVVKDGDVVLARGYGVCEVGDPRRVNQRTLFNLASCTKAFTAASVAVLVDQGQLQWDDPVVQHLPECQFSDPYMTQHATLRDFLCHRTGLQPGDLIHTRLDIKRSEVIRRIRFLQQKRPFRTEATYNNQTYAAVGEVVAKVSAQSWEEFVTQNLLRPLEMRSTTFAPGSTRNLASRHWRDNGKVVSRGAPLVDNPVAAAGGLYSCADDMAHWLLCQLGEGSYEGERILSVRSVQEMHAMHQAVPIRNRPAEKIYAARFLGMGLGWLTWDYRGRRLVVHSGSWGNIVGLVPEENLGVVVLSNLDWNGLNGMLMYRVLDAYCAPADQPWDTNNFQQFEDIEGPGYAYRARDKERRQLQAQRSKNTQPTVSINKFVGSYSSRYYGDIELTYDSETLLLHIGPFTTSLTHWEHDVFYAEAPVRLNYDFLVTFRVRDDMPDQVTLKYVGWSEPAAVFQRIGNGD